MNVILGTALVDVYVKCGDITKALQVFYKIPSRNALTYTAIIGGLAHHEYAQDALSCYHEMIRAGLVSDEVTFLGILTACSYGSLVKEGRKTLPFMNSKLNISANNKHFACVDDLLGRAGYLKEAMEILESIPMEANIVMWEAIFVARQKHKNVELGGESCDEAP